MEASSEYISVDPYLCTAVLGSSDLLGVIFDFLEFDHLVQVRGVSRLWNKVARCCSFHHRFDFRWSQHKFGIIQQLIGIFPRIRCSLDCGFSIEDSSLQALRSITNIETLATPCSPPQSLTLLAQWKSLRSFSLIDLNSRQDLSELAHLTHLACLGVEGAVIFDFQQLSSLVNLKKLDFNCTGCSPGYVLPPGAFVSPERVDLNRYINFPSLTSLTRLESLDLGEMVTLLSREPSILLRLTRLHTIRLDPVKITSAPYIRTLTVLTSQHLPSNFHAGVAYFPKPPPPPRPPPPTSMELIPKSTFPSLQNLFINAGYYDLRELDMLTSIHIAYHGTRFPNECPSLSQLKHLEFRTGFTFEEIPRVPLLQLRSLVISAFPSSGDFFAATPHLTSFEASSPSSSFSTETLAHLPTTIVSLELACYEDDYASSPVIAFEWLTRLSRLRCLSLNIASSDLDLLQPRYISAIEELSLRKVALQLDHHGPKLKTLTSLRKLFVSSCDKAAEVRRQLPHLQKLLTDAMALFE